MNYLAHAYLSFGLPDILVGNMISDFVKGKKKFDYPASVQKGIQLHRDIDTFTDDHPVTKKAKLFFKPAVGAYCGAFADVMYDHFLANDAAEFTQESLLTFTANTYNTLHQNKHLLPEKFAAMLPYMTEQNWLFNYSNKWGMEKSFGGVVHRATYLQSSDEAFKLFEIHYHELQYCYKEFFPSLKAFSEQQLNTLLA